MRRYQYTLLLLFVTLFCTAGCTKIDYTGPYSHDGYYSAPSGVYFYYTAPEDTLIRYSFGTETDDHTQAVVKIPVKILGNVSNKPRTFKVAIIDSLTTAKVNDDYLPLKSEYTIPADSIVGYVEVTILRKHLKGVAVGAIRLALELQQSNDFMVAFPDKGKQGLTGNKSDDFKNRVVITADDILSEPEFWQYYTSLWGSYSPAKYRKILSYYNGDPNLFLDAIINDFNGLSNNFLKVFAYFKAHPMEGVDIPDTPYVPYTE